VRIISKEIITSIVGFTAFISVIFSLEKQKEKVAGETIVEEVYHQTSFAISEGFTTSTIYNQPRVNQGTAPYYWDFLNGTVSLTNAITSPSAHLRGYVDAQKPALETVFAIPHITKVDFFYKSDPNISLNFSYSLDNRLTWFSSTNYGRSSSAKKVTYIIDLEGSDEFVNLRWQMQNAGSKTGDKAELIIDDITIYYDADIPIVTLEAISIQGTPNQTAYFAGDLFNPTGIQVIAYYNDATTKDVTAFTTYTPQPLIAGTTTVIAHYADATGEQTANITEITVDAIILENIFIKETSSHNTIFPLGEPFDYTGLIIMARYNNTTLELASGFTVSLVDTMELGEQSVTVFYDSKSTSYLIMVTNLNAQPGVVDYAADLIISEYIEGSANNKYLEIYNGTGQTVDLADYQLQLYVNGSATVSKQMTLSGVLPSNSTIIYQRSSAALTLPLGITSINSDVVNFNGDDALALYKISTGTYVDIFGQIGMDPGTAWTNGEVSTNEHTLVRKADIITGVQQNPQVFNPALEWEVYPQNTASYLGWHTMNLIIRLTDYQQALAFAQYVNHGIGENAAGQCGMVLSNLQLEYGYMSATAKNEFVTNEDSIFIEARTRMAYLETWAASHPEAIGNPFTMINNDQLTMIMGMLALVAFSGFYFTNKKKQI